MSSRAEHVRIGGVLSLERRPVAVDLNREYQEIGIRAFGRGIFHKEPLTGAALGSKRVYWIEPGDLVISNVFAWEGAIAVAGEADAGTIGSHRFMTFVPVDQRIDAAWAAWFFRSDPGLELIRRASPGSAGRNRTLGIERFAAIELSLPPIEEQRLVAQQLDAIRSHLSATSGAQMGAKQLETTLVDSAVWAVFERGIASGWPLRALGEVAEINPRPVALESGRPASFVPMSLVDQHTGTIEMPEIRPVGEATRGYRQFRREDVLFARITPCMQNGKTAVYRGATDYGYGSTEFHVVRAGASILDDWIHRFLRTRMVRDSAAQRLTGTAGQQRVAAEFLRQLRIPVPPLDEQHLGIRVIDKLLDAALGIRQNRLKASALAAAIEPAIINEAFGDRRLKT